MVDNQDFTPSQVGGLFTFLARQLVKPDNTLFVNRKLFDQVLLDLLQVEGVVQFNEDRLLVLAEKAQLRVCRGDHGPLHSGSFCCCYQICEFLFEKKHLYDRIIDCYLKDPVRQCEIFSYIHNLLSMPGYSSEEKQRVRSKVLQQAVNPGCVLEDFVGWYSTRDYVVEEVVDEKGNKVTKGEQLMGFRTIRLKFSFQVLHYFVMQKPGDVASHLFSCVINAALLKLKQEEAAENVPAVRKSLQQAASQANKLLHSTNPDYSKLEEFMKQLAGMETAIAQAPSLKAKFTFNRRRERGRPAQEAALLLSSEDDMGGDRKDFPSPAGREILLRTCVPRPAPYSRALPQRLFCVLMREEFRLAGTFSSDTSFF
ncbi:hypothetical protein OJAV_G00105110 [Oryzias javanicus]|uniref:Rab3 GTPase-activating protein catalytic subunit n=1 Tax=Oryzias javanicus TaxID=123683 RepID=A0A3S2Q200_ORYJA|nr:hypothetical protein OJAV_G00105110 [Oryzias javanicus]